MSCIGCNSRHIVHHIPDMCYHNFHRHYWQYLHICQYHNHSHKKKTIYKCLLNIYYSCCQIVANHLDNYSHISYLQYRTGDNLQNTQKHKNLMQVELSTNRLDMRYKLLLNPYTWHSWLLYYNQDSQLMIDKCLMDMHQHKNQLYHSSIEDFDNLYKWPALPDINCKENHKRHRSQSRCSSEYLRDNYSHKLKFQGYSTGQMYMKLWNNPLHKILTYSYTHHGYKSHSENTNWGTASQIGCKNSQTQDTQDTH